MPGVSDTRLQPEGNRPRIRVAHSGRLRVRGKDGVPLMVGPHN